MMFRVAVMLCVTVAMCEAYLRGDPLSQRHHHRRPRPRLKSLPHMPHMPDMPDIPDHDTIRASVERSRAHLDKMAEDARRGWPEERWRGRRQREEDEGRRGRGMGHRGRGLWHRVRDVPRVTGAGVNIFLDGLFSGLEDMLQPISGMDFGNWGLDWMTNRRKEPWYRGENVCETREEKEEDVRGEIERHQVTTTSVCDDLDSAYRCTVSMNVYGKKTTVTVTYTCCYGYERVEGQSGCPKRLQLAGLVETAQKLELIELLKAAETVKLIDTLRKENFTVFAPTDEAFQKLQPDDLPMSNVVVISPELSTQANQLNEILSAHLVPGFVPSTSMADEQLYESVYPRATIRINHYNAPLKMTMANCVPISSSDNLATNGVLHTVTRMLPIVTRDMHSLIAAHPHLHTLRSLVERTGLSATLREAGQMTLFAPTDKAFEQLSRDTHDYLLQANSCLKKALQSHVLPNVICSGVIRSNGRTLNLLGEYVALNRTQDDTVYVEGGAAVTSADLMATNGVIHLIDKVIVPKQVLNVLDVAREVGATALLELIQKAGLTKTLRERDDYTMFIPTNEAIEKLPRETYAALSRDARLLSEVLRFHVAPERISARDLYNDRDIPTLLGDRKNIRVKEYSSFPFSMKTIKAVQCAPLATVDIQSCNAVAHVVDKVLFPPGGDLVDVLALDQRFSRLVGALKKAELAETLQISAYTVFAPTNEAFDGMDPVVLKDLMEDKEKLKAFLSHHITHDGLCCSGMSIASTLGWFWKPVEMTLDPGSNIVFERSRGAGEEVLVDGVPITTCDMTATNGVVHAIDEFLPSALAKHLPSYTRVEQPRIVKQQAPVKYQF